MCRDNKILCHDINFKVQGLFNVAAWKLFVATIIRPINRALRMLGAQKFENPFSSKRPKSFHIPLPKPYLIFFEKLLIPVQLATMFEPLSLIPNMNEITEECVGNEEETTQELQMIAIQEERIEARTEAKLK